MMAQPISCMGQESNYSALPPIYGMEDYESCENRKGLYCKADILLTSSGNGSHNLWKLINESKTNWYSYDRSIIHRAVCVPREKAGNLESIKRFYEEHANKELSQTDLIPFVEKTFCYTKIQFTSSDYLILFSFILYAVFIVYATIYDKRNRRYNKTGNNLITSFSLISNWEKLCNINGNKDYQNLKCIQGIRVCFMFLILILHSITSYFFAYLSNIEELEKDLIKYEGLSILPIFFVQPFFLISSWILTYQIYNIYRDNGNFTVKQVVIFFINRYLRFGVCSAILIIMLRSNWSRVLRGPLSFDMYYLSQMACKDNCGKAILFLHNYLYFGDICNVVTWYLSVDIQLYLVAMCTIYIILKFKLNEWKVIAFLLFTSCTVYGSIIYINNSNIIIKLKIMRWYIFQKSTSARILYTPTYSNWTTSIIGIAFGIWYSNNKSLKVIKNRTVISIVWLLLFLGLPLLAVSLSKNDLRGIRAAIFGPLLKPLFSLGIGFGIMGMFLNIGGVIKTVCESKLLRLISNFSFSIYIFQLFAVNSKLSFQSSMVKYEGLSQGVLYALVVNVPLSVIIGIIGAFLYEQPGVNLQKIIIPQLPRREHQIKKD